MSMIGSTFLEVILHYVRESSGGHSLDVNQGVFRVN